MSQKIEVSLGCYLLRSKQLNIDANFYLSLPYLDHFEAICYSKDGWLWVEADDQCLFPPLSMREGVLPPGPLPVESVWSDFADCSMGEGTGYTEFLDWEYIYDPLSFDDMSGGDWMVFRKNSRKWPRTNRWSYIRWDIPSTPTLDALVADWLTAHITDAQDPELLASYALDPPAGVGRKILFRDSEVVAVNAWDINHSYINFRVCICRDEHFLAEFARLLFYQDPDIRGYDMKVNDGGTLGHSGLEAFKDKLNPIRKRKVRSWQLK